MNLPKFVLAVFTVPLLGAPVCGLNTNPLIDEECKGAFQMRDARYSDDDTLMCGDDVAGVADSGATELECEERTVPICDFLPHIGDRGAIRYSGEHACSRFTVWTSSSCYDTSWTPSSKLPLLGCEQPGVPDVTAGETILMSRKEPLGPIDALYFAFQDVVFAELADGTVARSERTCDRRIKASVWGYGRDGSVLEETISIVGALSVTRVKLKNTYDGEIFIDYEVSPAECLIFCGDNAGDVVLSSTDTRDPIWMDRRGAGHSGGLWGVGTQTPGMYFF